MSISPDTPRAYRPKAELPAGVTREKDFQFKVSNDWTGRKVNYEGKDIPLNEAIQILSGKVFTLDLKPTTEAEKIQLKNQIRALIVVVEKDNRFVGYFNNFVNQNQNEQRLTDLNRLLGNKNLDRKPAALPKQAPLPTEVADALKLLKLDKIPNSPRELFQHGYQFKAKITPDEYKEIVQATKTILEYKQAQKKHHS